MGGVEELGERWYWIFRTLSAGPRRQIVESLMQVSPDRTLSLPEAANPPDRRLDPEKLRQELAHNHLPLMEQRGYIEWKREPLRVGRGPAFEDVAAVLEAIYTYDDLPQHLIESCRRLEVEDDDS